jgi:transcriptional regulator with XRE-family HTH domain
MSDSIEFQTPKEIMQKLANGIKKERIAQNITQENFSIKCGVSFTTYKRLENKGKGTLENFIAVLISLGKVSEIANILQPMQFSPKLARKSMQYEKTKKRASRPNTRNRITHVSGNGTDVSSETRSTVIESILNKYKNELEDNS